MSQEISSCPGYPWSQLERGEPHSASQPAFYALIWIPGAQDPSQPAGTEALLSTSILGWKDRFCLQSVSGEKTRSRELSRSLQYSLRDTRV